MASPIVAAVAAMIKVADRSLQPTALRALIKANTDNIDLFTQSFVGRMGSGRVNALRAVRREQTRFAEITNVTLTDQNNDGVFSAGETIGIEVEVPNLLQPLNNVRVVLSPAPSSFQPKLEIAATDLGAMRTFERKSGDESMQVTLSPIAPLNAELALMATIFEGDTIIGRDLITATVNPSYRTMKENNLSFSVNSVGNIGFNDYPDNEQGIGFQYRNGGNLSYEGGFMIGVSPTFLPNVVRGASPSYRDNSFKPQQTVDIRYDSVASGARSVAVFDDSIDSYGLGLLYRQTIYQPTADSLINSAIVVYDVTNPSDTVVAGIHGGLYFDWDTSPLGATDGCAWDHERGVLIHQNAKQTGVPTITVSLLSAMNVNAYAIDNGGSLGGAGVYDGFQRAEKWLMLSSGIARRNSSITDVSMVLAGGPFDILPGETRQLVFAIVLGETLEDAVLRNQQNQVKS